MWSVCPSSCPAFLSHYCSSCHPSVVVSCSVSRVRASHVIFSNSFRCAGMRPQRKCLFNISLCVSEWEVGKGFISAYLRARRVPKNSLRNRASSLLACTNDAPHPPFLAGSPWIPCSVPVVTGTRGARLTLSRAVYTRISLRVR